MHGDPPRVTYRLPAQRSQTGLDTSRVQLTARRIDDDAGREPEILRDLMELARQVGDDAGITRQRRNEDPVARGTLVRRGSATGRKTEHTYEHHDGEYKYSTHAASHLAIDPKYRAATVAKQLRR